MTERYYPWDVLKIDKTDDKKLIKKAYACLIKQYKPDENPDKFKSIQGAYKLALSMLQGHKKSLQKEQQLKTVEMAVEIGLPAEKKPQQQKQEQLEVTETIQTEEKKSQPHKQEQLQVIETVQAEEINPPTFDFQSAESVIDATELEFEQQQQNLINNLYQQLHTMAFSSLSSKDKLENWKFIEDYYQIEDLNLKAEVAKTVFKKVAEYNLFQLKQNNTLSIKPFCLRFMDDVFDWSDKWEEYQLIFPTLYFDYIDYAKLKKNIFQKKLDKTSNFLGRFWAFILDVLIAGLIASAVTSLKLFAVTYTNLFPYTLVLIPFITELVLKQRSSLGKWYSNLIVVDEFGNTCSRTQLLLRYIYFYLFIIPVYLDLQLLFNVLILIHAWFLISKKVFLHDFLSNTIVIKTKR